MPEQRAITRENIDLFVPLYTAVFNAPPWHDGWSHEAACERLRSLADCPAFDGESLWEGDAPLAMALGRRERWVQGWHFHLKELCVHPDRQGLGLGRQVLSALEARLAGAQVQRVFLETGARARPFYESLGYRTAGLASLGKDLAAHAGAA